MFLLLFLWQVAYLCGSYTLQNEDISAQTAYFVEELQEEEDLADGLLGGIDFEETEDAEDDFELISTSYLFSTQKSWAEISLIERLDPKEHFQNPFSPPEMIA